MHWVGCIHIFGFLIEPFSVIAGLAQKHNKAKSPCGLDALKRAFACGVMHMKLSELNSLLSSKLSGLAFLHAIAAELAVHQRGLAARGQSAPAVVVEDRDILVSSESIKTLCHLFVDGQLNQQELAYIADAMQFGERVEFSDPAVADMVAELTDPEINGVFTKVRALQIIGDQDA